MCISMQEYGPPYSLRQFDGDRVSHESAYRFADDWLIASDEFVAAREALQYGAFSQ